jgi:phenylacetate-CoA ligase
MPFFDHEVETMLRPDRQALQLERLRSMIDQLDGTNRFITEKLREAEVSAADLQTVNDLALFPFTSKDELRDAEAANPPLGTNATFPQSAYTRFHQTSGTSGKPIQVLDTVESWDWWGRCWGYVLAGAGVTKEDRLFVAFSFGPFIGFWSAVEGAKQVGTLMIPGGGRNSEQRLALMKELGVTAVICTPTYALRLAEVARETGFDLGELPVRKIIVAGEPGANVPATKVRIEDTWDAQCFDHGGASEVGAHSFECERQPGGTHAIESEFIVEVLGPETGEALPAGETGELVITNLGRLGFPVIRYRTGDLVRLNPEPCECGRTFARFEGGLIGRADDMVIVRGINIFPSAIENLVRRVEGVNEYRATVSTDHTMRELTIEIEVAEESDPETARRTAQESVQNTLGLRPSVTVVPRDTLPRFKLKGKRFSVQD